MNIYYVYAYIRKSNGTPYYIGKGKNGRAFSGSHSVPVPDDRLRIVFLEKNLTEIGAYALERRYISWYGRKINNTGILLNKSVGGPCGAGSQRTSEWRKNHSRMMLGQNVSEKTREKLRNLNRDYMKTARYRKKMSIAKMGTKSKTKGKRGFVPNSKKIITPHGIFLSMREAADKLNITLYYIMKWTKNNENGYSLLLDDTFPKT